MDFIYPELTYAQTFEDDSNTEDVVRRVRFSGNDNIKDRTLLTLVRTRTNREFLSIPGSRRGILSGKPQAAGLEKNRPI